MAKGNYLKMGLERHGAFTNNVCLRTRGLAEVGKKSCHRRRVPANAHIGDSVPRHFPQCERNQVELILTVLLRKTFFARECSDTSELIWAASNTKSKMSYRLTLCEL